MNLGSSAFARRRLFVAAFLVAGCSGLSRDPLGDTREQGGGRAGAVSAGAGHSTGGTTSSKAGRGGAGTGGVAGDEPVISSGGVNRGGSGGTGGTGGSGSRGGSGAGGSGAVGNAGESGDGGVGGSVAGSGQPGGRSGGGTAGVAGQAGEGGAAGDAGSDNCAEMGPPAISTFGLVYWFSADFGVTEADQGISQWCDRSGNGAHATQHSPGPRPNLGTFPGTDLPAIVFDGVDEYLDLPPQEANFEGGLTFFCVARATYDSNGMAMLKLSNGPEANDVTFLRFAKAFTYEVADEPKWGGEFVVGEPRLVDVGHAMNGIISMFMNGISVADASFPTPFPGTRTQNFIGRTEYNFSTTWTGEIAEIVLYNRLLDPGDRQTIRSYLSEKWNCCTD